MAQVEHDGFLTETKRYRAQGGEEPRQVPRPAYARAAMRAVLRLCGSGDPNIVDNAKKAENINFD
eukprot:5801486-Heterocapsa_arctica.AAC.1